MRLVLCCALLSLCALGAGQPGVVIVFQFDNEHSAESFDEMQGELARIMQQPGVEIEWREKTKESSPPTQSDLVIVRFQGRCTMAGLVIGAGLESGPLAVTHIVNGEILPFSDVDCDRVCANVRAAILGHDARRAEFFLGRALGRVVAHELFHMLSKSSVHGRHGLMRRWLSGPELIGEHLELAPEDVDRVLSTLSQRRHPEMPVHGGG